MRCFERRYLLTDSERELEQVYRRELAGLLRQAAAIRAAREPLERLASFPLPRLSERIWRRQSKALLATLTRDRWSPRGARFLARLVDRKASDWPRVSRMAEAARRVEDSEFARICLGHALLIDGYRKRAEALFSELARRPTLQHHRWRVMEGLAICHELAGRHQLALRAADAAADDSMCGLSTLVYGLFCALRAGDVTRTRRAAARLDMLADSGSPEFIAAVRRLAGHRHAGAKSEPFQPHRRTARSFRALLAEDQTPSGRVCRALA